MIIDEKYIEKLESRFWPRVGKKRKNQCWLWLHSKNKSGYGKIGVGPTYKLATHVMWFLTHGDWPKKGEMLCHKCDTPACVNPSHLFRGDSFANMQDCVKKKRHVNSKKTTCHKGHSLSDAYKTSDGKRICRPCSKEKYILRRGEQVAHLGMTAEYAMSKDYRSQIYRMNAEIGHSRRKAKRDSEVVMNMDKALKEVARKASAERSPMHPALTDRAAAQMADKAARKEEKG